MSGQTSTRGVGYTKHLDLTQTRGVYENPIQNWNFLYQHSTTKNPEYNVGDRVCLPDGRAFRYCKCGTTLTKTKQGVANVAWLVAEKSARTCVPTSIILAGAQSAAFTVTAGEIGGGRNGIIAEDELRGGYISFYGSSTDRQQRGIMGNTALAVGGTSITIYWDAGTELEMAAATATEILPNPYMSTGTPGGSTGYETVVGMPNVLATVGQYFWVQTWGIFRITPVGAAFGSLARERQFVFTSNGGIESMYTGVVTHSWSQQIAGYYVERSDGSAESAAPFINLTINP